MNIILMSGGSGKRLWPLSNETRSKQFLKLIENDEHELESMVQRVYRQVRTIEPTARILIATSKNQVESIRSQLGSSVDVVIEPERRDTFPAIALSSAYLALKLDLDENEPVLVLPVDPYADLDYFKTLKSMEEIIRNNHFNMTLMGIEPTYPSAKYGYIIPDSKTANAENGYQTVERFQEKPSEEFAEKLIQLGAVWNGGVFAFKLHYMMQVIRKYIEFQNFEDVLNQYRSFPKISFDYEVVEKEPSIAMVKYKGTWKDLGTWNTLTEVMSQHSVGRMIRSEDCENTHVINELDIPLTVLGTRDLVIAASPDGILVSDKHKSSHLKPLVDQLDNRPMYEERRWGEYRVLETASFEDGINALTKHMTMKAGTSISYQKHFQRDEVWTIIDGEGLFVLDGERFDVKRGSVLNITRESLHGLRAITDLHFIEVQIGDQLVESDIERFDWPLNFATV